MFTAFASPTVMRATPSGPLPRVSRPARRPRSPLNHRGQFGPLDLDVEAQPLTWPGLSRQA
jgi:hypothetical protein